MIRGPFDGGGNTPVQRLRLAVGDDIPQDFTRHDRHSLLSFGSIAPGHATTSDAVVVDRRDGPGHVRAVGARHHRVIVIDGAIMQGSTVGGQIRMGDVHSLVHDSHNNLRIPDSVVVPDRDHIDVVAGMHGVEVAPLL